MGNVSRHTGPGSVGPLRESIAALMAPLGDPNRIAVLEALTDGEANVQQIADQLDLPHRNVSHHATVLCRAGILARRPEGREVFYSIDDWSAWWLVEKAASVFSDD